MFYYINDLKLQKVDWHSLYINYIPRIILRYFSLEMCSLKIIWFEFKIADLKQIFVTLQQKKLLMLLKMPNDDRGLIKKHYPVVKAFRITELNE